MLENEPERCALRTIAPSRRLEPPGASSPLWIRLLMLLCLGIVALITGVLTSTLLSGCSDPPGTAPVADPPPAAASGDLPAKGRVSPCPDRDCPDAGTEPGDPGPGASGPGSPGSTPNEPPSEHLPSDEPPSEQPPSEQPPVDGPPPPTDPGGSPGSETPGDGAPDPDDMHDGPPPADDGCRETGAACVVGVGQCEVLGLGVICEGEVLCDVEPRGPRAELCNGLDDDCDGVNDEIPDRPPQVLADGNRRLDCPDTLGRWTWCPAPGGETVYIDVVFLANGRGFLNSADGSSDCRRRFGDAPDDEIDDPACRRQYLEALTLVLTDQAGRQSITLADPNLGADPIEGSTERARGEESHVFAVRGGGPVSLEIHHAGRGGPCHTTESLRVASIRLDIRPER